MGAYSKLHNYTAKKLHDNLPDLRVMENYHPDWLLSPIGTRLELDIFLPEINTAIEIQGAQHFSFTSFFHKAYSDFEKQKEYDEEKRNLCHGAGIRLIEVCTEKDADIFAESIMPEERTDYSFWQSYILGAMRVYEDARPGAKAPRRQDVNKAFARFLSDMKLSDEISPKLMQWYAENRKDIDRRIPTWRKSQPNTTII